MISENFGCGSLNYLHNIYVYIRFNYQNPALYGMFN